MRFKTAAFPLPTPLLSTGGGVPQAEGKAGCVEGDAHDEGR